MKLSKNGKEITTVEEWFALAPPRGKAHQWKDGYSAKELAKAWCSVPGRPAAPPGFVQLLACIAAFPAPVPVHGYPEHRIRFDTLPGEPRNTDLALECESSAGRVAVSVEAKARESFGKPVEDVLITGVRKWADEERSNYLTRLEGLYSALFRPRMEGVPRWGELRYQLLTAAAGALTFAAETRAAAAVLLVHEFRPEGIPVRRFADNERDLWQFVQRIATAPQDPAAEVWGPFHVPGNAEVPPNIPLYITKLISACDAPR